MGYGRRALEALDAYYSGIYLDLAEKQTPGIDPKTSSSLAEVKHIRSSTD